MSKYFYAVGIFAFSALIVLTGLLTSNVTHNSSGRVAGVQSNDQLFTYAVNYPNKQDLEVYCDGQGAYVAAIKADPIPSLPSTLAERFQMVHGRGYFIDLDAYKLNQVIMNFAKAQGTKYDYASSVAACHLLE